MILENIKRHLSTMIELNSADVSIIETDRYSRLKSSVITEGKLVLDIDGFNPRFTETPIAGQNLNVSELSNIKAIEVGEVKTPTNSIEEYVQYKTVYIYSKKLDTYLSIRYTKMYGQFAIHHIDGCIDLLVYLPNYRILFSELSIEQRRALTLNGVRESYGIDGMADFMTTYDI